MNIDRGLCFISFFRILKPFGQENQKNKPFFMVEQQQQEPVRPLPVRQSNDCLAMFSTTVNIFVTVQ